MQTTLKQTQTTGSGYYMHSTWKNTCQRLHHAQPAGPTRNLEEPLSDEICKTNKQNENACVPSNRQAKRAFACGNNNQHNQNEDRYTMAIKWRSKHGQLQNGKSGTCDITAVCFVTIRVHMGHDTHDTYDTWVSHATRMAARVERME